MQVQGLGYVQDMNFGDAYRNNATSWCDEEAGRAVRKR